MYLVDPDAQEPSSLSWGRLPASVPRPSVIGSARYYMTCVAVGVVLGVVSDVALSAARAGADVVWTERAMTWSWMVSAILGALVAAGLALGVDELVHRRRHPAH